MSCLFCHKENDLNTFSIYHILKQDTIKFLGENIKSYLNETNGLCINCTNLIEYITRLRDYIWSNINKENINKQFTIEWNRLLNFLQTYRTNSDDDNDDDDDDLDNEIASSPLVELARTENYESIFEKKLAEQERITNTISRANSLKSDKSSTKSKHRKRRRYRLTQPKKNKYIAYNDKRTTSSLSLPIQTLSGDRMSRMSDTSNYTRTDVASPTSCITINSTWNRLQSDQDEFDLQVATDYSSFIFCDENGCYFKCEIYDDLIRHKLDVHRQLALYYCNKCKGQKFVSRSDLRTHDQKVHKDISICVICRKEFKSDMSLLFHWRDHLRNASKCHLCEKRYLNKSILIKHIKDKHQNSNNIINKIDFHKNNHTNITTDTNDMNGFNEFKIRYLIQCSKDKIY